MKTPLPLPELTEKEQARFWRNVDKNGPAQAHRQELGRYWVWTGYLSQGGYGLFRFRRHPKRFSILAHRLAFYLTDSDPESSLVLHQCDNPLCCRPSHLSKGDQRANIQDMVQKGRDRHRPNRGTQSNFAKLTEQQVASIRQRYVDEKTSLLELAAEFNVHRQTIARIVWHDNWSHLGGPTSRDVPALIIKHKRGSECVKAKLDENKVSEIRRLVKLGVAMKELAERFSVSPDTIGDVTKRRTWKHVD